MQNGKRVSSRYSNSLSCLLVIAICCCGTWLFSTSTGFRALAQRPPRPIGTPRQLPTRTPSSTPTPAPTATATPAISAAPVTVDIDLPSTSTNVSAGTLAVRLFAPGNAASVRHPEGAPIVVFCIGGESAGTLDPNLQRATDVVRVQFLFPGGQDERSGRRSSGAFDFRGERSSAALRDVILYAAGMLPDSLGRRIDDVLPVRVQHRNIGLYGNSNGGNIIVAVAALYGAEISQYVRYFIQWESPVCSQVAVGDVAPVRLLCSGGTTQTLAAATPWYDAANNTLIELGVDYRRVRYDANNFNQPLFLDGNGDGRYTTVPDPARAGCQTPDLNGDGQLATLEDYPLKFYRAADNRLAYSRQATQAFARHNVFGTNWPSNILTVTEANAYWDLREATQLYERAFNAMPQLEGMFLASLTDHVQTTLNDKAHAQLTFNNLNTRGKWVKINPARSYVVALDPSLSSRTDLPNNLPNVAPSWSNPASYCFPDDVDNTVQAAAVQEMADRARQRNLPPPSPTPTATPTPVQTPTPTPTPSGRSTIYISGTMHIESNRLRWPNVDALLAFFTRATQAGKSGTQPTGMRWSVGADIGWLTGEPRAAEVITKLEAMGVELDVHAHEFADRANNAARITQLGGHPNKVSSGNVVTEIDRLRLPVVGRNGATWQAEILYGTALRPDHSEGSEDFSYGIWRPKSGAEFTVHDPNGNLISVGGGPRTLAGAQALIDYLRTATGLPPVFSTTVMVHPDSLVNVGTAEGIVQIEAWAATTGANVQVRWATLSQTAAAWLATGGVPSRLAAVP